MSDNCRIRRIQPNSPSRFTDDCRTRRVRRSQWVQKQLENTRLMHSVLTLVHFLFSSWVGPYLSHSLRLNLLPSCGYMFFKIDFHFPLSSFCLTLSIEALSVCRAPGWFEIYNSIPLTRQMSLFSLFSIVFETRYKHIEEIVFNYFFAKCLHNFCNFSASLSIFVWGF